MSVRVGFRGHREFRRLQKICEEGWQGVGGGDGSREWRGLSLDVKDDAFSRSQSGTWEYQPVIQQDLLSKVVHDESKLIPDNAEKIGYCVVS